MLSLMNIQYGAFLPESAKYMLMSMQIEPLWDLFSGTSLISSANEHDREADITFVHFYHLKMRTLISSYAYKL